MPTQKENPHNAKQYLQQRAISLRLLKAQGFDTRSVVIDYDGQSVQAEKDKRESVRSEARLKSLTIPGAPHRPLQGMVVPYQECLDSKTRARTRWLGQYQGDVWSDSLEYGDDGVDTIGLKVHEAKTAPRWESGPVSPVPYLRMLPQGVWTDQRIPLVYVEAPVKAMALAQYGIAALGKAGADAGLHRKRSDDQHSPELCEEARRVAHKGRTEYLMMDSGQIRNPMVALGVGRDAWMLSREGADVRVCYLPERVPEPGEPLTDKARDQGPDDLAARVYFEARILEFNKLGGRVDALTEAKTARKEYQALREANEGKRLAAEADGAEPPPWPQKELKQLLAASRDPSVAAFEEAEVRARRRAGAALRLAMRKAKPWSPADRIREAGASKEDLLRDLVFQAILHFCDGVELTKAAQAWGRGGKGILQTAIKDFRARLTETQRDADGEERGRYYIEDGVYHYEGEPVCNFTAEIKEEIVRDDGIEQEIEYRIVGKHEDGAALDEIPVKAEDFASMKWTSKWPSKACIAAGKLAADHTRVAIQTLSQPSRRRVYAQTGWREIDGKHVYILPGGGIGPEGHVEVECSIEGRYRRPALPTDDGDLLECLVTSLKTLDLAPDRVTVPLLAMVYLPALRPLVPDGLDFTVWLHAQTGSMKSSLAGVMQSHYGDFSYTNLPGNWDDTVTTLEKHASTHADALWTSDNLVPPKTAGDQRALTSKVNRIVQSIGDGQGRGRQTKDLKDRKRFVPRAGVLSTAETLPPGGNESTYGRLFAVKLTRGEVNVKALTAYQTTLKPKLARALGGYLRWLAGTDWDLHRAGVEQRFRKHRDELRGKVECHPRLPGNTAKLLEGINALCNYADHVGLDKGYVDEFYQRCHKALLEGLSDQPRAEAATASEQWLQGLQAVLRLGRAVLVKDKKDSLTAYDPSSTPIGWLDGEEVLLDPLISYQEVSRYLGESWRYDPSELYRQLLDATTEVDGHDEPVQVLATYEGKGTDGRKRADVKRTAGPGGARPRVLVLQRIVTGVQHCGLQAVAADSDDPDSDVYIG